jgi:hypothetical protein
MSRSRPKYRWNKNRTAHQLRRQAEIRSLGETVRRSAGKDIARVEKNAANYKKESNK